MTLLFFINIIILTYATTKAICGLPADVCVTTSEYQSEQIFVFRWLGFYYAESWCVGEYKPFIRKRTRFALTKDKAIELAQWDIRTAHTIASWDD